MKYKIFFGIFIGIMFILTIVSRIMEADKILVVNTVRATGGNIFLKAAGTGTVFYGIPETSSDRTAHFYVRGYVENMDYIKNLPLNTEVILGFENGGSTIGKVESVLYDYKQDKKEILVTLEGENYQLGDKANFLLQNNAFISNDIIPLNTLYEDEQGYFVYLLELRQSMIGNSTIAVKKYVQVDAFGEGQVAILDLLEEFNRTVKIIETNGKIYNGMKVREREF